MNYLDYFSLAIEPFARALSPDLYVQTPHHQHVLKRLQFLASGNKGLGLVLGDTGLGKSTLAKFFASSLSSQPMTVGLFSLEQPLSDPLSFLEMIVQSLTLSWQEEGPLVADPQGATSSHLLFKDQLPMLARALQRHKKQQRQSSVVIIDEAQYLQGNAMLDALKGLLALHDEDQYLISVVLLGLPTLEDFIKEDQALQQRIAVRCLLKPYDKQQCYNYICYRLHRAVRQADQPITSCDAAVSTLPANLLWSPEVFETIYRYTQGIPRLINILCDNILVEMYLQQQHHADDTLVEKVAQTLALTEDLQQVLTQEVRHDHGDLLEDIDWIASQVASEGITETEIKRPKKNNRLQKHQDPSYPAASHATMLHPSNLLPRDPLREVGHIIQRLNRTSD